jgi:hypothetical protein
MNWIKIQEIDKYDVDGKSILIWQRNLADAECSRFHRAIYYNGNEKVSSFVRIYPITTSKQIYMKDNEWIDYDLEGDMCQITHFAIVQSPNIN